MKITASAPSAKLGLARVLLLLIVCAAVIAVVVQIVAFRAGDHQVSQLLAVLCGPLNDWFGDYFTFIFSFPAADHVSSGSFFDIWQFDLELPAKRHYLGVEGLPNGKFTHLHGMPLMTLFCLVSIKAMAVTGGVGAFVISYTLLAIYWHRVIAVWEQGSRDATVWFLTGLLCYPCMMMIGRGNIYAGITGVLIVHSLLLASRRTAPILSTVLLALAINIRPNAVLFAVPLLLFHWPHIRRVLPVFCLAGAGICLASLAVANWLYPDYTLPNLLAALQIYYRGYVVDDTGLFFGSSLYGALKLFFGYRPGLDIVALVPSIVILLLGAGAWALGRLSDTALLFLTAAAYCLGSSVIADYHLFVFLLPPMVAARANGGLWPGAQSDCIAVGASALILMSKNVSFFVQDLSVQILLNPLILLAGACIVLWLVPRTGKITWRSGSGDQVGLAA